MPTPEQEALQREIDAERAAEEAYWKEIRRKKKKRASGSVRGTPYEGTLMRPIGGRGVSRRDQEGQTHFPSRFQRPPAGVIQNMPGRGGRGVSTEELMQLMMQGRPMPTGRGQPQEVLDDNLLRLMMGLY
jgi:hypothetical protein